MYRVNVTPIVGLPRFGGWSQVVSSNFFSSQLVCAFSVVGDYAGNAGRDLTEQISQAKAVSPSELKQLIDQLTSAAQELDVKIQLVCGVFTVDKVILGTYGGSIFLKRGARTGILLSSVEQIKIIEGKRVEGDTVVLITHQATDFVNEIKQKFIAGFDVDSVVTSIIPGLHGLNDSSLSSIAFVSGGREWNEDASLDIPPALKLRGAGKNRMAPQPEPMLENLGQISQDSTVSASAVKVKQGFNSILRAVIALFKHVHYQSILAKMRSLWSRLRELFWAAIKFTIAFLRKVVARDIYLKTASSQQLKRIVLPAGVAVMIVASSIGFRIYQVRRQLHNVSLKVDPIVEQINLAKDQLASNPVWAREAVSQAIDSLTQLEKDFSAQKKAQRLVSSQLVSARELYDQISGQEEFEQLEIFYDLRLVDNEFVVSALDASGQRVAFLDAGQKKAIALDLKNKQVQQFDLNDIDQLTDLELIDSTMAILGGGVLMKNLENNEAEFAEVIAEGDSNRNATLIESFATYIYILNPEKRNIYRYAKQPNGYSKPIGWVSGAAGFDYQQVASWAIDGEVWVTTRNGELHKLAAGREQKFEVTGLAEPFTHSLQVFTREDLQNLYVLEPDGKRLVILNKKGEFLKEIKSDSLVSTTALFVSEELSKAFAVSGSIVYAMSI